MPVTHKEMPAARMEMLLARTEMLLAFEAATPGIVKSLVIILAGFLLC